jgi:hypothetical protein
VASVASFLNSGIALLRGCGATADSASTLSLMSLYPA